MSTRSDRPFDVVLFGATGFTGRLVAEYVAKHYPRGVRWAIAGRNREKLESVRSDLSQIDGALGSLEILVADSADSAALDTSRLLPLFPDLIRRHDRRILAPLLL